MVCLVWPGIQTGTVFVESVKITQDLGSSQGGMEHVFKAQVKVGFFAVNRKVPGCAGLLEDSGTRLASVSERMA